MCFTLRRAWTTFFCFTILQYGKFDTSKLQKYTTLAGLLRYHAWEQEKNAELLRRATIRTGYLVDTCETPVESSQHLKRVFHSWWGEVLEMLYEFYVLLLGMLRLKSTINGATGLTFGFFMPTVNLPTDKKRDKPIKPSWQHE